MSKYDNVGICLQKEADESNNTALNSSVYQSSRRKSVPGTPGTQSGASPHHSTHVSSSSVGSNPTGKLSLYRKLNLLLPQNLQPLITP